MASSPAHKFGQELGVLLEDLVLNYILKPRLLQYTETKNLYLDSKEFRPARGGKLVSWPDRYGNVHNLDFVIEAGGSREIRGKPLAFIEAAWRRYTKHSRNKAQEIQGALLPIIEQHHAPFCGVVLAGEFTKPSIEQLESNGFTVLYIPYSDVIKAFKAIDFNIGFNEGTPDEIYELANEKLAAISKDERLTLRNALTAASKSQTDAFMQKLSRVLDRSVKKVILMPLFGQTHEFAVVLEALAALPSIDLETPVGKLTSIEVWVDYSNGDSIRARFASVEAAHDFLKTLS